jgi:tetratricopeptide (TPR) repeat protein
MEPSKDIYHKEVVPFLARRKKQHARQQEERISSLAATPALGPGQAGQFAARRAKSHRSSHHRPQRAVFERVLWTLLGASVGVYLAALGLSFVIHRTSKPAAATSTSAPPAASAAATPADAKQDPAASAATGDDLLLDIRRWTKANELYETGMRLSAGKQPGRAVEKMQQALEESPNLIDAHVELANLYVAEKNFASAEEHLRAALSSAPGLVRARLMLAEVLAAQGRFEDSLAAARWVLESDPYSLAAHQCAATAYVNLGQPSAAIDHLKRLVVTDPHNLVAQNMLAQSYTRLGQHAKALAVLRELQTLDASNPMTYYNLAVCYAQQNMAQQALDVLAQSAGLFDRQFVLSWMESREFDPIRGEAGFSAFQAGLRADPAAAVTNAPAAPTASTVQVSS